MTSLTSLTLDVDDLAAAQTFYDDAFGLGDRLSLAQADAATAGFRGFVVSLLVAQPADVSAQFDAAIAAGATAIKPVTRSMGGVGGSLRAPDGSLWKVATSAKKDTKPASRTIEQVVILVAANDVGATKKFYVATGLTVGKSFGKYVEFALPGSPIGFGLYSRKALAKDAGVDPEGDGAHRVTLVGDLGSFSDPDGFRWESAS